MFKIVPTLAYTQAIHQSRNREATWDIGLGKDMLTQCCQVSTDRRVVHDFREYTWQSLQYIHIISTIMT